MWLVHVIGNTADLARFDNNSTSLITIVNRDGAIFLSSHEFEGEQDPRVVVAKARDLCRVLQGLAKVVGHPIAFLNVGDPIWVDGDGNLHAFARDSVHVRDSVTLTLRNSDGVVLNTWSSEDIWTQFAQCANRFPLARMALMLWGGSTLTYRELVVILEIIKYDDYATYQKFTSKTLDRLFATANSMTAAGSQGRHGPTSGDTKQPPRNPMSLDEAVSLTGTILKAWLTAKAA